MPILLRDIWNINEPNAYKVHFARWNGADQPLEVLARSRKEWQAWQEYRPGRDEFKRQYIFSLAQFYHEPDAWLFGGMFHVLSRYEDRYDVELLETGKEFIGRLKLGCSYRERATRVNFENHYPNFEVLEILRESYTGRSFPGYESIDISFNELATLADIGRPDWKTALESIKGIYLITDTKSGKRYVGKANGEEGIWSRWCSYILTGHGGNVELKALVSDTTLAYQRTNFRFALLEHWPNRTADNIILGREDFWKRILLTRGEQGLNRN